MDVELDVAARLVRAAGARVREWAGRPPPAEEKAGGEPVSVADREASALIVAGLRAAFPDDAVVSEEEADDRRRLLPERRVWFVDPIDGTIDFLAGRPGYAVQVGLAVAGRPVLGLVLEPASGDLHIGVVGGGARTEGPRGVRPLATVAAPGRPRLISSVSHRAPVIDEVRRLLDIDDELRLGSVGVKLARIAAGSRDLYVNPAARSKAWDTCAPEALLVAAGGVVSDLDGRPLRYDQEDLVNRRGILAAGRVETWGRAVAALSRVEVR